jgi:hypothetical protein
MLPPLFPCLKEFPARGPTCTSCRLEVKVGYIAGIEPLSDLFQVLHFCLTRLG